MACHNWTLNPRRRTERAEKRKGFYRKDLCSKNVGKGKERVEYSTYFYEKGRVGRKEKIWKWYGKIPSLRR
jgi:hypothetical protein